MMHLMHKNYGDCIGDCEEEMRKVDEVFLRLQDNAPAHTSQVVMAAAGSFLFHCILQI